MKYLPPLRYSIPALLGLLGLLLVSLAFYDGVQRSEQLIENEASAQVLTFGTRITARLESLEAGEGSKGVRDLLQRISNEPHLRAAAIVDAQGRIIESPDAALRDKSLDEMAPQRGMQLLRQALASQAVEQHLDNSDASLTALFPFALPAMPGELRSRRYAVLYLRSDLSETKRLNWARHVERARLMGAIVALALALVWAYFHWAVTKRLAHLTNAMQRVTDGDLSVGDIGVYGHDELGRLSTGFTRMVAEIRQRRSALAASEERYRSVVNAMSEGIVIQRSDGSIIGANESACRILGLTQAQISGRNSLDLRWRAIHEDGTDFPGETHPAMITLRTGQPQLGTIMGVHHPDGTLRWITINSEPCVLAAAQGEHFAVATLTDITERRAAEFRSERDRQRLAAIVDSAMDAVICTGGDLSITLFNRGAERIFGRREADMLDQSLHCLLPERFRDALDTLMRRFAASGVTQRAMAMPGDIVGVRAHGEEFPIEASISCVNVGREVVLTAILRDISERKRAEAQHEQLEAQLRHSQKMQSLGTLTGGIAHDFNNLLTAISGNTKLAQIELQEANLPVLHPVRRSLTEIMKAAERATDLVRQVLAFSRQQKVLLVATDLSAVVAEALKFLRAMLPAMIEIRSQLPDDLPMVAVDATQIHQVITNFGSNAAHAIGERSGAIDVSLTVVEVSQEAAQTFVDLRPGHYVRLIFTDNGCGMEPATIERIFEPFFTTKQVGQGTGLGLSVVHGIVKSHDGAITIDSTPGVGTCFNVYFPVCTHPVIKTCDLAVKVGRGRGQTIVYIDDEEALVFLVTRILQRRGYRVLGFNQPEAALQEFAREPEAIDALVSDLAMPGISGFDVVRCVRAIRPDIPLILVSGYLRSQDIELAESLGVHRLVLKPDTVDELAQALDEVLARDVRHETEVSAFD